MARSRSRSGKTGVVSFSAIGRAMMWEMPNGAAPQSPENPASDPHSGSEHHAPSSAPSTGGGASPAVASNPLPSSRPYPDSGSTAENHPPAPPAEAPKAPLPPDHAAGSAPASAPTPPNPGAPNPTPSNPGVPESPPAPQSHARSPSNASTLYGPPFESRGFGAEFVWASSPHFVSKVLRVRKDEKVRVTGQYRRDMSLMLTGGRACLEIQAPGQSLQSIELEPAKPVPVDAQCEYRLIAMTDVELFTIYSPA